MTLCCGILTLKTSDSFFRSFCFLRQNEALSATEQNQTYKNSLFLETSMQFSNRIKCDVGANKNAGQAFSMPRLSSHFILYKVFGFRFFSPSNQDCYLVLYIGSRIGYNVIKYYFAFLYEVENQRCEGWKYYCRMFREKMDIWS